MMYSAYKLNKYSNSILLSQFCTSCYMSSYDCCFLTCTHVSQEAHKVVWFSQLFKSFSQFIVIHTVKGFSTVIEEEVDVFLEFPCFFYNTRYV